MGAVLEWARAVGAVVVVDAAQAHGARLDGRGLGAAGDAVAWSFYPTKNLGASADAGAVTSANPELVARVARLRNYGSESRDRIVELGVNSRLDELQRALLRVRLSRLDVWNGHRRALANRYRTALSGLPLVLPPVDDDRVQSACHLFVVRVHGRDRVRAPLAVDGVETLVHYALPPHRQPALASLGLHPGAFPVAERLAGEILSLPLHPHLDELDVDAVVCALTRAVAPSDVAPAQPWGD